MARSQTPILRTNYSDICRYLGIPIIPRDSLLSHIDVTIPHPRDGTMEITVTIHYICDFHVFEVMCVTIGDEIRYDIEILFDIPDSHVVFGKMRYFLAVLYDRMDHCRRQKQDITWIDAYCKLKLSRYIIVNSILICLDNLKQEDITLERRSERSVLLRRHVKCYSGIYVSSQKKRGNKFNMYSGPAKPLRLLTYSQYVEQAQPWLNLVYNMLANGDINKFNRLLIHFVNFVNEPLALSNKLVLFRAKNTKYVWAILSLLTHPLKDHVTCNVWSKHTSKELENIIKGLAFINYIRDSEPLNIDRMQINLHRYNIWLVISEKIEFTLTDAVELYDCTHFDVRLSKSMTDKLKELEEPVHYLLRHVRPS